jgi:hypothetical protein
MSNSVKISQLQQPGSWSSCVDAHLASALKACNVRVEPLDPTSLRLRAVPLSAHFNKMRTNLLIHRAGDQICAYVDFDLDYNGPNHAVRSAFNGPRDRNWRQLNVNISAGNAGQVVRATLEALGSPVIDILQVGLGDAKQPVVDGPLDSNSILATETRAVEADNLAAAFKSSVHKPLAQRMAVMLTRQPPSGCVVWAPSGAGKGHLLRTTAHILLHGQYVSQVRHLPAARLTCGRVFPAERDGVLSVLLDELVDRPRLLLLVDHLDLGMSGTMPSLSLLAEALDRGAHLLATVQDESFLKGVQEIPALARRLLPVKVPRLNPKATLQALQHLVRASGYDVSPAALLAAVEITERQSAIQPAAAIDLLRSALAEARWRTHKQITPDDVTSVLKPDWPQ